MTAERALTSNATRHVTPKVEVPRLSHHTDGGHLQVMRSVAAEEHIVGAPRPAWMFDRVSDWGNVRGARLEEAVSAVGNVLAHSFPGLRVFHSVALREDGRHEIDMVLMLHASVVLVEAKHVSPGMAYRFLDNGKVKQYRYRRTSKGRATTDSKLWPSHNLDRKMTEVQEQFPTLAVSGMYVFAGSERVEKDTHGSLSIIRFENLVQELTVLLKAAETSSVVTSQQKGDSRELAGLLTDSAGRGVSRTTYATALVEAGEAPPLEPARTGSSFWERLKMTWQVWTL